MAEILGSSTCDRFQTWKPIILFLTYCLILYLKSNVKCFRKGRALSNIFWIYQDKIVIACRIEFNPTETIKQFINWSEDSDKKQQQYLTGAGVMQSIHCHQYTCDFFPFKETKYNFPKVVVVVVFLYTPHLVSLIAHILHYWCMANFNFPRVFYYCF